MSKPPASYVTLPPKLSLFMAELATGIETIDLTAIQAPGSCTPNTPEGLADLLANLRHLPALNNVGSAGLNADATGVGWCRIERNGLGLSWGVWVGTNDGTEFGHNQLVAGIDNLRRRSFIAEDAPEALDVIRRVLTSPDAILRGVSRGWDGLAVTGHPGGDLRPGGFPVALISYGVKAGIHAPGGH